MAVVVQTYDFIWRQKVSKQKKKKELKIQSFTDRCANKMCQKSLLGKQVPRKIYLSGIHSNAHE